MKDTQRIKSTALAAGICLLSAFACLAVCSMSSFLYKMNDWLDVNCYYTVGRGMFRGLVPYKDLYEQKGPLLYFLYGFADLVFPSSYLGGWLLELIAGACFLFLFYKTVRLFAEKAPLWLIPAAAFAVFASFAFAKGGSAEELFLPFFAGTVYTGLKFFYARAEAPVPLLTVAVQGFCAGCILWVKFTWLGLYAAWAIVLAVFYIRRGWGGRLAASAGIFVAGAAATTLPWLIYFGANGAIGDWLKVYIYDNIFLYAGRKDTGFFRGLASRAGFFLRDMCFNVFFTLPALGGLMLGTVFRKKCGWNGWTIAAGWAMFGGLLLGIYSASSVYHYYSFPLAAFAPVFAAPAAAFFARLRESRSASSGEAADAAPVADESCAAETQAESSSVAADARFAAAAGLPAGRKRKAVALALSVVISCCACIAVSGNRFALGAPERIFPQIAVARTIREDAASLGEAPTLLNFAGMDGGIYRAAGIAPNFRYFSSLNVSTGEMTERQFAFLSAHGARYAVTYKDEGREKMKSLPEYELIFEGTYYPGEVYKFETVRTWSLYRLSPELEVLS